MYMSLPAISRATLFHFILNPLLVPSRASTALASIPPSSSQTTSVHFIHSQSSTRLGAFSVFHPQCPADPASATVPHPQVKSHAAMSTHSSKAEQQPQAEQRQEEASSHNAQDEKQSGRPLALPDASSADSQTAKKLDVSGGGDSTVTLDHLGPMVVNQDGTLSRITNWAQMTEIEKKNTLRVLGKRNKLRLDAVKAAGGAQGEE